MATGLSAHAAEPPKPADAKVEAAFRDYLNAWFQAEPLAATQLGDHRHDDKLDDLSAEARAVRGKLDQETLSRLTQTIDPKELSRDARIDFEIFRHHLESSIWLREHFQPFEDDPRVYGDYLTGSVYLLFAQSTRPKAENLKNALARMDQLPRIVAEARRTIKNPPRVKTETAIKQTQGAIAFYQNDVFILSGEPKDQGELAEKAKAAVAAIEGHLKFLKDEVLPRSSENWRIGRELFVKKLALELDSGISADEVLHEAESEAVRVERELAVVARQLWGTTFPGVAVPPDDPVGRREMTRRVLAAVAKNHGAPETIVADAARHRRRDQDFHSRASDSHVTRSRSMPHH